MGPFQLKCSIFSTTGQSAPVMPPPITQSQPIMLMPPPITAVVQQTAQQQQSDKSMRMAKVKAKRAKLHKYEKYLIWKGDPGRHPTSEIDFHMHPITKRYYPVAYLDMEGNLDDNRM